MTTTHTPAPFGLDADTIAWAKRQLVHANEPSVKVINAALAAPALLEALELILAEIGMERATSGGPGTLATCGRVALAAIAAAKGGAR